MALRVVIADDNLLVREGVVKLLDHQEGIEVVATCGTYDELMEAGDRERPTSSSPTSACPRPAPTKASAPPLELRDAQPGVGRGRAQPVRRARRTPSRCSSGGSRGPGLPPEGAGVRPDQLVHAIREVAARRQRDRPEGRRVARARRARPGPRRRSTASRPASARSSRRWRRAGTTPGIAQALCCRSGRSRSTSTRCSPSSAWARKPTSTAGSRPCSSSSSEQGG